MVVHCSLRLFSKWFKCHSVRYLVCPFYTYPPYLASVKKGMNRTRDCSRALSSSFCWHREGQVWSENCERKFSSRPVPPLCVGAKAVVNVTVTEDMVKCFAQATGDWNPIHFDASKTESEETGDVESKSYQMNKTPIVHGALLNGIVSGVIGIQLPGPGTIVISQAFQFPAPLPVDTLVAVEVEVLDLRRREVNVKYKIVSVPGGIVVMDGTARLMVPRGRIAKVS